GLGDGGLSGGRVLGPALRTVLPGRLRLPPVPGRGRLRQRDPALGAALKEQALASRPPSRRAGRTCRCTAGGSRIAFRAAASLRLSFLWLSFHSCDCVQFQCRVLFSSVVPNG